MATNRKVYRTGGRSWRSILLPAAPGAVAAYLLFVSPDGDGRGLVGAVLNRPAWGYVVPAAFMTCLLLAETTNAGKRPQAAMNLKYIG